VEFAVGWIISSIPIRQTLTDCWPRAASGHAIGAPPSRAMKSRLFN